LGVNAVYVPTKSLYATCYKELLYFCIKESGSYSYKIGINKCISVCSNINKCIGFNT
jgi:hypothetical protein